MEILVQGQWVPLGGSPGDAPGMGSVPDIGILRDAVEQQESGGNPNAVSPAGALGRMQTMPGTLESPGFGVAPAKDRSDGEMTRVGNEYLQVMVDKYGPVGGLAAYNWGPGNWEAALASSGGNPQAALAKAPKETQDYVPSVLRRAGAAGSLAGVAQPPSQPSIGLMNMPAGVSNPAAMAEGRSVEQEAYLKQMAEEQAKLEAYRAGTADVVDRETRTVSAVDRAKRQVEAYASLP